MCRSHVSHISSTYTHGSSPVGAFAPQQSCLALWCAVGCAAPAIGPFKRLPLSSRSQPHVPRTHLRPAFRPNSPPPTPPHIGLRYRVAQSHVPRTRPSDRTALSPLRQPPMAESRMHGSYLACRDRTGHLARRHRLHVALPSCCSRLGGICVAITQMPARRRSSASSCSSTRP